jgi:hypothetical protein
MGSIYLQVGHYDDAIRCFEMAIELSPKFHARVMENLKMARILRTKTINR